jgi:hypothetical protein
MQSIVLYSLAVLLILVALLCATMLGYYVADDKRAKGGVIWFIGAGVFFFFGMAAAFAA